MTNLKFFIGACFLTILLFELTIDAVTITEEGESKSNSDRRVTPRRSGSRNSGGRSESQIVAYSRGESRRRSGGSNRRKSSGRDNGKAIMQPDKKANFLKRMGSNVAISMKLPMLADVKTLKSDAMENFHKYTGKAAKARAEKEEKIDKMKLDEDLESAEEMWLMDVAKVALGYHKIMEIIYGDIESKKMDHCKEIIDCFKNLNFESEQKAKMHLELLNHINDSLGMMKKDRNMVNKAKACEIDLLSMFHRISGNNAKYYKEYFDKNILDEIFEIEQIVEDTVEAKFNQKYNKKSKKARDPRVTEHFVNARIAALRKRGGGHGRTTRGETTQQSDNYSTSRYSRGDSGGDYSRSESRRSGGRSERHKSRSERGRDSGGSSRRRSPSRSRSGRSRH